MSLALEASGLIKVYRGGVRALQDISAKVPVGSLYCLAGPNGAGKTTFIRIASTVTLPTAGYVSVLGYDVVKDVWKVRKHVALMPQEGSPFTRALKVWEAVYYYLRARGLPASTAKSETRRVLEELALWEYRDRLVMSLSGGLRRRVLLAKVLATSADVIFLDEPTAGLDPSARRSTWGYIRRLVREGQTILFSTHLLAEAEQVADLVLILRSGRKIAEGRPAELVSRIPYRYKVIAPAEYVSDSVVETYRVRMYEGLVYIYTRELGEAMRIVNEVVEEGGEARVRRVDLEDFFVEVIEDETL